MAKILSFDLASTTGYAFMDTANPTELLEYGTSRPIHNTDELGEYPRSYVRKAFEIANGLVSIINRLQPDIVIIEESNPGGRAGRYSQKQIEFFHCALVYSVPEKYPLYYISTSVWRKVIGLTMSKDDKANNKLISKAKQIAKSKGMSIQAAKKSLGVRGKRGWKHISLRLVNDMFDLQLKQKHNDIADAICLAVAYCNGASKCCGID